MIRRYLLFLAFILVGGTSACSSSTYLGSSDAERRDGVCNDVGCDVEELADDPGHADSLRDSLSSDADPDGLEVGPDPDGWDPSDHGGFDAEPDGTDVPAADGDADVGRDDAGGPCVPIGGDVFCNGLDDDCDGVTDEGLWCAVAPDWLTSDSRELRGVWGTAPDDVWVVGSFGTVLHWDGATWTSVATGSTAHLESVWCAARDQVWIVGEIGTILHWDGTTWDVRSVTDVDLHAVRGISADDIWAVGDAGTTFRWSGDGWGERIPPTVSDDFYGVWPVSHDEAWATGCCSPILHWDGSSWQRVPVGMMGATGRGAWASGPSDVWVVGEDIWASLPDGHDATGMLHWDGVSWNAVPVEGETSHYLAVWGASPDAIWAGGWNRNLARWDGATWTGTELGGGLGSMYYGIWGASSHDLWIVGNEKTILHWRE